MMPGFDVTKTHELIGRMEGVVRERTPYYVSLDNPVSDTKLMAAHYCLARLYAREGENEKAHENFDRAQHEFYNMCRVLTKKPTYVFGEDGFKKLREQERKSKKKISHFRNILADVGKEVGVDPKSLLSLYYYGYTENKSLLEKISVSEA